MISFIKHRVNLIQELHGMDEKWGAEIDIRSNSSQGELFLSHDPWSRGELLGDWLKQYHFRNFSGPLVLNTKEDGLELRVLELLNRYGVKNFFFLDTTVPSLVKWTFEERVTHFAVRFSCFESEHMALKFSGKAEWLWVDCFGGEPVETETVYALKKHYKICLVSPELQGYPSDRSERFLELFHLSDAVCTKDPSIWMRFV